MSEKILVIGRHNFDAKAAGLGESEITQENIQFPGTAKECSQKLDEIMAMGFDVVLFQAIPAQMAVALAHQAGFYRSHESKIGGDNAPRLGVVISKPGERPGTQQAKWAFISAGEADEAKLLVEFANPRAKVEVEESTPDFPYFNVTVEVEPPMRFDFSHIEWF